MRNRLTRNAGAALAMALATFTAASAQSFPNGQSYYGTPVAEQPSGARVVKLGTTKSINVQYGEVVTFEFDGRQFAWRFDGLDRRTVNFAAIAPAGFKSQALTIYVGRDTLSRR